MILLAYVYPHPTTPTPRKRKGWERALLPLSLFWKPGEGFSELEGAATWLWTSVVVWVWIFSETIKSTSLCIIYHSCIPTNKLHFFHKGNNLRLGPTKYWSEICMKLSTHPWLVLLCMLTGEDGEKGLFAMQVRWFSVYLLKMCNTLYLKPVEHKTTCSSDDMGKFH